MPFQDSKKLALDILSRRDNSVSEIQQKLKIKGIGQEEIADTITWLTSKKLLNDTAFAQRKAESIFRTKLVGPAYIKNKLRAARISGDISDDVVGSMASEEEWQERARKAIAAWKRAHPKHAEDKTRHMRFLASRGFDLHLP